MSVCLLHFFVSYASSASLFSPTLICVTCTNKYSGRRLKNHLIFTVFSPVYSNKVWERKNSHHKFSRIRFWECLLHLYILGLWPSASITLSETPILNFTLNLLPWHVHCFVIRGKVKWWQAKVLWNNSWRHCRWKGRNWSWQPKWLCSFSASTWYLFGTGVLTYNSDNIMLQLAKEKTGLIDKYLCPCTF